MSIKLKRRSVKFSPLSWGLTAEVKKNLAAVPNNSLQKFRINEGTATDWWNFTFRIVVGLEAAKQFYIQETVDQFQAIFDKCVAVREQYFEKKTWTMDAELIEEVQDALDAVMQIHEENIRRVLLPHYYTAQKVMHKLT